jgi:hypothetical protein
MPLGHLGRMSLCLGPVSMIIPPFFVMHGRRVFDAHFFQSVLGKNNLALMRSYPQPEGCACLAYNKGNKIGDNQIKGDGKAGPFPRTFPLDHNDGHNTGNV